MKNKATVWMTSLAVLMLGTGYAGAAGTYYMGNYQSPQQNYAQMGYATMQRQNNNGYYYYPGPGNYTQDTTYTRTRTVVPNGNTYVNQQYSMYRNDGMQSQQQVKQRNQVQQGQNDKKFKINAGLNHEFATWRFDMTKTGSVLHYDNLRWNVLDATGQYDFNIGSMPARIEVGAKYGWQFGESTMVDDDTSSGGYLVTEWNDWDDANNDGVIQTSELTYIGQQVGHALSIGTTDGGSMFGFNAGFGLTDFFKWGNVRFTPSVGYRYLRYKLETKNDYGLTVDTGYCSSTGRGTDEIQCDPIVVLQYGNNQEVLWNPTINEYGFMEISGTPNGVSTAGTYAYRLPGVSHSYEVEWAGPYLALDMIYDINQNNAVTGRIELGLPMYTATGDQPYRPDWQHPTSVEDKGGLGDAWHFGMNTNYLTALSDTVSLSLGLTFDYYSVSGADASTHLNSSYYRGIYNDLLGQYEALGYDEAYMLENDPTAQNIVDLQSDCPGWVCKSGDEVDSVYRSLGFRVGIQAKF
ncbi:MAG: hypothetical protein K5912_03820 [Alphaproteobacteria bacterium]|nr:hypothetical protein [Alphaproteobacteria bacterium]